MKYFHYALVLLAACSSSGGGSTSEGAFLVIEGLSENTVSMCVDGLADPPPQSFVVRNNSFRTVNVSAQIGNLTNASVTIDVSTLNPGQTGKVTVMPGPAMSGYRSGTIDVYAAAVGADGNGEAAASAHLVVTLRYPIDDRAYTLSSVESRVLGRHAVGVLMWTATNPAALLPEPPLAFDGPFTANPPYDGFPASSGYRHWQMNAGGAPGEEVTGAVRVVKARCSPAPLAEQPAIPVSGRRGDIVSGITTGLLHSCALVSGGRVLCWGDDTNGQLARAPGSLSGDVSTEPLPITQLGGGVTAISAGRAHTCALRSGEVFCWGDSTFGQCGVAAIAPVATPNKIALSGAATGVFARGERSCAILGGGTVACWGRAGSVVEASPALLTGVTGATQVALGDSHQCTRTAAGVVSCSGTGGRVGDGTANPSATPVQVLIDASDIAAGASYTCAATKTGKLMCWGEVPDSFGGPPWLSPQQNFPNVAPQSLTLRVAAANQMLCALGTGVECNVSLQLFVPTITAMDAGGGHLCAIFEGGKLACMGRNERQQLGPPTMGGFDGL